MSGARGVVKGVRLPPDLWQRLKDTAAASGQSRNNWIEVCLTQGLERHDLMAGFADAVHSDLDAQETDRPATHAELNPQMGQP